MKVQLEKNTVRHVHVQQIGHPLKRERGCMLAVNSAHIGHFPEGTFLSQNLGLYFLFPEKPCWFCFVNLSVCRLVNLHALYTELKTLSKAVASGIHLLTERFQKPFLNVVSSVQDYWKRLISKGEVTSLLQMEKSGTKRGGEGVLANFEKSPNLKGGF